MTIGDELAAAVVITMTTTPDRLAGFRQRYDAAGAPLDLYVYTAEPADDRLAGNWQSHHDAIAEWDAPVLIFEDDAVFAAGFTLDVEPPPAPLWDLFFFGGDHFLEPRVTEVPGVVRGNQIRQNHCYAVRDPVTFAALLGDSLPGEYLDGRFGELKRDVVSYAVMPFTVGQDVGQSNIDPKRYRPEPEFWNRKTWPDYGADWL